MKGKVIKTMIVIIVVLLSGLATLTAYFSRPLYSEKRSELPKLPDIAPKEQALTFARTENSLLLITGTDHQNVNAINLSAIYGPEADSDPIAFYHKVGYDSLATLSGPHEVFVLNDLRLPINFGTSHVAAGTNYKAHSDEVLLDDPPFLFPKNTEPTPWNAPIQFTKRLDYEAELAAVPLSNIRSPEDKSIYGLVLVNDFTNRWTLVKELKLRQPMGTTGFAASKGYKSFLPTGCFLVIPKDEEFFKNIELRLYVNDKLRQRFMAEDMILKVKDIVNQSFTDRQNSYQKGDSVVELIPKDGIERGSLVLTGTAGGVIFKPVNIWWQGLYLKPGDIVRTEASFLGHLENKIQPVRK